MSDATSDIVVGHGSSRPLSDAELHAKSDAHKLTEIIRADERAKLRETIWNITHPGEGPCPICGHVFDAHVAGCWYERIDAIFEKEG